MLTLSWLCPKTNECPNCVVAIVKKQDLTARQDDSEIYSASLASKKSVPVPAPREKILVNKIPHKNQ